MFMLYTPCFFDVFVIVFFLVLARKGILLS
jgi:hypothetical protein